MRRDELEELHFITAIDNVPSILEHGILSHYLSASRSHRSLAKQDVQEIRRTVTVPGGQNLHRYANLYITARNPALRLMIGDHGHQEISVLRVSTDVLDVPHVVITDQNAAARKYCRFAAAPEGLRIVDKDMVFAEYWTHPHPADEYRHRSVKCAEVLVLDRIDPNLILGGYVSGEESLGRIQGEAPHLNATINRPLFFL
ncbi:MAG: DUF4433 domain-containing protein [Actinomycetota bacterium]